MFFFDFFNPTFVRSIVQDEYMKLKNTVIQRILDSSSLSLAIAMELGFTQDWVRKLAKKMRDEKDCINGPLTTAAALGVIKKDMGILDDSEVLDKVPIESVANAT